MHVAALVFGLLVGSLTNVICLFPYF